MKDKKLKFSSLIVILAILNINLFTGAVFWLTINDYIVVPDVLITCFFSFWGLEMLSLAGIRKSKAKYYQSYEYNLEEDQTNQEDDSYVE